MKSRKINKTATSNQNFGIKIKLNCCDWYFMVLFLKTNLFIKVFAYNEIISYSASPANIEHFLNKLFFCEHITQKQKVIKKKPNFDKIKKLFIPK